MAEKDKKTSIFPSFKAIFNLFFQEKNPEKCFFDTINILNSVIYKKVFFFLANSQKMLISHYICKKEKNE